MLYQVTVMFDKALGAYSRPMFVQSRGQAIRAFGDEVNNPEGEIHRHPSDYELFYLGTYDDSVAHFESAEVMELLARGGDLLKESS